MDTTIDQQVAMDEALVPHAQRLRIGKSNFRLLSDIKSKESTLQLVYDVLRICPFFKVFFVTAVVPEIYMQEFWGTTTVHHHAIRFKMDNKKHIMNLESFRDMLHICPRVPGQSFAEPPFEEEILAFIRFLRHSIAIRNLTDVNINKLYQPWGSFAAIINKSLTGKSSGYDSLRLSQAQILWRLYHKSNVDYAYLMWEDFVYQVEHKNSKKSNEMYYPRDDHIFSTIKLVSRHQNTQQFGALLPIELINKEIRNSNAYKEYYEIATGAAPPKPKASVQRTRSSSDKTITPPTAAAGPRLTTSQKGKQAAKASKAKSLSALFEVAMTEAQLLKLATKRSLQQTHISQASGSGADEGTGFILGVPDVPTDESEKELSWNSTDEEGDDEGKDCNGDEEDDGEDGEEGNGDDEDDDVEEGDDDEDDYLNVGGEEGYVKEEEEDKLYKDVNINQGRGIQETLEVEDSHVTLTPVNPDGMESIFKTTLQMDIQTATYVAPLPMTAPTMSPSIIATITTTSQAPILPTTASSTIIQDLPNFGSLFGFDNRLRTLEANFFEFMQTNQFAGAVSAILGIVQRYMDQRMNETVKVAIQIQSDRLCDEAQKENDKFLKTVDENMQKIIKEQVKEQVKVQVSKILPRIQQTVNEQLEAEVLTRSSHSSNTSYAVAADLSEMELKKILIEKIEGNKSIQRFDEQRNLYKALAESYESDKIILDTYGETVTLKRRHDDDVVKDEEPSVGPGRWSKRRREGKEPETASAPMKTATRSAGRLPFRWKSPHIQSLIQKPPTPDRDWNKTLSAVHRSIQPWISELAKQTDSRSPFDKLMDTPLDISNFLINRLKVDTLTPELLAGPTYKLMKGSCKSLVELEYHLEEVFKATTYQLDWVNPKGQQYPYNLLKPLPLIPNNQGRCVIPFEHFINNELEYLRGGALSRKYTTSITKSKAADYGHIKWIEDLVSRTMCIAEPIGYDKHALWGVSHWRRKRQQNKDKKNRLMRIDELHKFSDGTLIDVRTALDDRLKGIQMQYLPQSILRKSDKDRAAAMIQAIDKRLKTKRIMRSLERFVGGRLYEGDFRMLQRTI
nr:hypothetical protein [Tanacetum cinerariifolium]